MALITYNLREMTEAIYLELSLGNSGTMDAKIQQQINKAYNRISALREDWPWLSIPHVVDTFDQLKTTVSVVKGSRVVSGISGTQPKLRSYMVPGTVEYPATTGYLVKDLSAGEVTLDTLWVGNTAQDFAVSFQCGAIQLPKNFRVLESIMDPAMVTTRQFRYQSHREFEFITNTPTTLTQFDRIYTISEDPAGVENEYKYLLFYPYYYEVRSIRTRYFRQHDPLLNDEDLPLLEVRDRHVLLEMALWFMSAARDNDKWQIYRDTALSGLQEMRENLDHDATVDMNPRRPSYNIDTSALRATQLNFDPDFRPGIL